MVLVSPQRPSRGFASWLVISRSVSSSTSRRKLQVARNLGLAGQSNLWPEAQRAGNRTLALASFAAVLQPLQDPYSTRRTVRPTAASMGMRNTGTKGGFENGFPFPNGDLGFVRQAGDPMHLSRHPSEIAVFPPSAAHRRHTSSTHSTEVVGEFTPRREVSAVEGGGENLVPIGPETFTNTIGIALRSPFIKSIPRLRT